MIVVGIWSGCLIRIRTLGTCIRVRVGFLHDAACLMRGFSGFVRVRRWRWIRSSGCCWRRRGRRWSGPGSIRWSLRGSRTGVFAGVMYHDYGRCVSVGA